MSNLIFDNSPLSHFARAGQLEALDRISRDFQRFVTQAVLDELEQGSEAYPSIDAVSRLSWLTSVRVDGLPELQAFAEYSRRLGSGARDIGEASTLAWAETHAAIAILDERAGTRHGRERGVEVHGTLWLVARGIKSGVLTPDSAETLIDGLRDAEAWFPSFEGGFVTWARTNRLL